MHIETNPRTLQQSQEGLSNTNYCCGLLLKYSLRLWLQDLEGKLLDILDMMRQLTKFKSNDIIVGYVYQRHGMSFRYWECFYGLTFHDEPTIICDSIELTE